MENGQKGEDLLTLVLSKIIQIAKTISNPFKYHSKNRYDYFLMVCYRNHLHLGSRLNPSDDAKRKIDVMSWWVGLQMTPVTLY